MANSWLDAGWVEEYEGPFSTWTEVLDEKNLWDKCIDNQWTVDIGGIYHVAAAQKKTRWNFECPTHHPVPTEAIILGNILKLKNTKCLTLFRMLHSHHDYTDCYYRLSVVPWTKWSAKWQGTRRANSC